jgi:predicted dehydrogenase
VAALKNNIDAITEKPMTIDAEKVREILEAEKKSSASVQVTFNYRYAPAHTRVKEMVLDGLVGRPTLVDFNYYLDTFHGSSYFKRWNRYEKQAGSLLVTKACHHFDLVNWWLGQNPVEVFAFGKLNYYGADGTFNPEKIDGRRCSSCKTKCKYYLRHSSGVGDGSEDEHLINFNNPGKNEKFGAVDGYYADRCIFDSDIDTWDTFSVSVLYDGGTMMSYSLDASVPYEGYRAAINGTEGRLETRHFTGKGARLPFPEPPPQTISYFPIFEAEQIHGVINKGGGHGGGDPILYKEVFMGKDESDRTKRYAGAWEGAMSVLLGTAARESLKSGKPIKIADLLEG